MVILKNEKTPTRFGSVFLVGVKGLDSHACGRLVVGGRSRPPEGCSVPPPLRVPSFEKNTNPVRVGVFGRSEGTRTPGILLPKQARYQLRYTPKRY